MNYETDDFAKDVVERSHKIPVLVDFWAEWCGPCKVLGPVLERMAEQDSDGWVLAKLDTEKYPMIAGEYGIRSIPNVKLFVDGQVKDEFVGALPEATISQWLRKALPSKHREQLEEARQLLAQRRASEAQAILQDILGAEPNNEQAIVLLAQVDLYSDPQKAIDAVRQIGPGSEYYEAAEAIKTIADLFRHIEDGTSLAESSAKGQYLDAIHNLRAGDFESALGEFIDVIRKDRYYDDDGSRKACVAVFKLLGENHEITKRYRLTFSSALY